MIILGTATLVVGLVVENSIATTVGMILLVVGVNLAILGGMATSVGGRRHWY